MSSANNKYLDNLQITLIGSVLPSPIVASTSWSPSYRLPTHLILAICRDLSTGSVTFNIIVLSTARIRQNYPTWQLSVDTHSDILSDIASHWIFTPDLEHVQGAYATLSCRLNTMDLLSDVVSAGGHTPEENDAEQHHTTPGTQPSKPEDGTNTVNEQDMGEDMLLFNALRSYVNSDNVAAGPQADERASTHDSQMVAEDQTTPNPLGIADVISPVDTNVNREEPSPSPSSYATFASDFIIPS